MTCCWSRSFLLCHDHNEDAVVNSRVASACGFIVGLCPTCLSFLENEDLEYFKACDKGCLCMYVKSRMIHKLQCRVCNEIYQHKHASV